MVSHICSDCDIPGEGTCKRCHGSGKVLPDKSFGQFHIEIVCPRCKGNGTCPTCGGTGTAEVGGEGG